MLKRRQFILLKSILSQCSKRFTVEYKFNKPIVNQQKKDGPTHYNEEPYVSLSSKLEKAVDNIDEFEFHNDLFTSQTYSSTENSLFEEYEDLGGMMLEEYFKNNKLNFRELLSKTIECVELLNTLPQNVLEKFCETYSFKAFDKDEEKTELFLKLLRESQLKDTKSDNDMLILAQSITMSFNTLYEFIDRGMKGMLTGDITSNLICSVKKIMDKYIKDIQEMESDLGELGIRLDDFYNFFFKIDKTFFKLNTAKNISLNLSKHFEDQGIHTKKLLYFVNLKQTQFFDNFNNNPFSKRIAGKPEEQIVNNKKNYFQSILNDLYNDIFDEAIINSLKTPFYGIKYASKENKHNLFRRQLVIEEGCFEAANKDFTKIFTSMQSIDKAHELFFNRTLLTDWHYGLNFAIAESQKNIILNEEFKKPGNEYLQYFISLSSEEISMLSLLQLLKIVINNLNVSKEDDEENFLKALGKKDNLEDQMMEINIPLIKFSEELGTLFVTEMKNTKVNHNFSNDNARFYLKNINHNMVNYEISKKDKIRLGVFLAHLLKRNIKFVTPVSPTLDTKKEVLTFGKKHLDGYKTQNVVKIDPDFVEKYYSDLQRTFSLNIQIQKALPMIYKPMPWRNYRIGCYFLRQTPFSKIPMDHIKTCRLYEHNNISSVVKSLDLLGQVKWRINTKVLNVVEYIWANGGGKGEIPKRYNERVITRSIIKETYQLRDKTILLKESQHNREMHSLRSDFMIKLNIAKNFAKCNEIYYPHNIDYRGRAYPISPHLNHIGNDLCRGLLEYSERRPLGKSGLRWLKIHLANVIGKDKLTLLGREQYADSIVDLVHKCAKDPFKNEEWLETENPWQTLATMFELSNALNSKNPERYETNIHVHVDGSCNGLQHYTALSRDKKGGFEVGLMDRDRPGDVYSKVLEIVLEKLKTETNENDKKYADKLLADNIVNRRVIKQTVMTSVYGVTLIGARDQIKRQLKDKKIFDPQTLFYVSMYLAKKTIESIGDLFREANAIKAWLTKCALSISSGGYQVNWITPLGLPCVQPYKKLSEVDLITTHAQGVTIISDYDSQPVNKRKQGTAFPPNYIHSLDSAHMMYTSLEAQKHNIVFSSVHDSYWCHPSDMDKLNEIIRHQFVNLHSQPLLETLYSNFKLAYPELVFPEIPERGTLDLKEVIKSTYFFS